MARVLLVVALILSMAVVGHAQCDSQLLYLNGVYGPGYGGKIMSLDGYGEPKELLQLPLTTNNSAQDLQIFYPYLVFNAPLSAYYKGTPSVEIYDVRTLKKIMSIPNLTCEILVEDPEVYFGEFLCLNGVDYWPGKVMRINPTTNETTLVGQFPQMTLLGDTHFYHPKYKMFFRAFTDNRSLKRLMWGLDVRTGKATQVTTLYENIGRGVYNPYTDQVYTLLQQDIGKFSVATMDLQAGQINIIQNFTGEWTQTGFDVVHSNVDNCPNMFFTMISVPSQGPIQTIISILEITPSGKIVYERTFQPGTAPNGMFAYYPNYLLTPGSWK